MCKGKAHKGTENKEQEVKPTAKVRFAKENWCDPGGRGLMNSEIEVIHAGSIQSNDPDAIAINEQHQMFMDSCETAFEYAYSCGRLLIAKKDTMRHGNWIPWVDLNCDFDITQAWRYMKIASKFARAQNIKNPKSIRQALLAYKPPEQKEKVEQPFDWAQNTRVEAALKGITSIRQCVAMLKSTNKEIGAAKYYLKMIKEACQKIADSIEE